MVFRRTSVSCASVFGLIVLLVAGTALTAGAAQSASPAGWEGVLQAARKEGQVVIYGVPGEELLNQQFKGRYPGIQVVFVPGGGERIVQIMAERRAGKYLSDLYIGGKEPLYSALYKGGILDPIKDALILPEVVDESKWRGRSHLYLDDDNKYIFNFNEVVEHYFHHNTKAVDPGQFTSYWDLLDPKWNRAAHPNASKVFINWLLSREGQIAYQTVARQTGGVRNSLRTDISKDEVPSYVRPLDGGKYWEAHGSRLLRSHTCRQTSKTIERKTLDSMIPIVS